MLYVPVVMAPPTNPAAPPTSTPGPKIAPAARPPSPPAIAPPAAARPTSLHRTPPTMGSRSATWMVCKETMRAGVVTGGCFVFSTSHAEASHCTDRAVTSPARKRAVARIRRFVASSRHAREPRTVSAIAHAGSAIAPCEYVPCSHATHGISHRELRIHQQPAWLRARLALGIGRLAVHS